MEPQLDVAEPVSSRDSTVSSTDSISQRLSRLSTSRNSSSSVPKPAKGPLGLHALSLPSGGHAIVDLVFVHGLGGGSHTTWTASKDSSTFWPLEWLPTDPDFVDVRIHSFGYNSSWDKESILGIHDFANSLVESILNSPTMPPNTRPPLVFVAHSMGGLIVKRAFILAQTIPELASSFHSMFFLATPHQGSDLAQTLSRFLSISSRGSRPFISDLRRQSAMIQSLNDEFLRHCQRLQLFSFFESLPTELGLKKKTFIVDRASAVLGYSNERIDHLQATHRDICKYGSRDDPNYQTLRNALASVLRDLRSQLGVIPDHFVQDKNQRRLIEGFLGVQDNAEDDFVAADGRRMNGSCEWLIRKRSFLGWLGSDGPPIYSMTAKPGTGKTVLSGKVIAHLRATDTPCSFYFFRHRNKGSSDISKLLLSLARQMALQDPRVLECCLEVREANENLSRDSYRPIWRKLFLESILPLGVQNSHFWVLDALDECEEESELIPLLLKAAEIGRIRIFLTSRKPFKPIQRLGIPRVDIITDDFLEVNSRLDISLYLQANIDHLPALTRQDRKQLVTQILEKSQGSFLWTTLVLQELRNVHASIDITKVLEEIPSDMNDLYARILGSMSQSLYGKDLAKAIITWTVCAPRAMTTYEMQEALGLDLQDHIDSVQASIESGCGQLVYVDGQSLVQMVHLTARDYILHPDTASEFAVDEKQGHRRLLSTCLQSLQPEGSRGTRLRRAGGQPTKVAKSHMFQYAAESFYEHLRYLSWTDTELVTNVARFFTSQSVLAWVEFIAERSDLSRLINTGNALGEFLCGISQMDMDSNSEIQTLASWATDLVRLVMKFGSNLKAYPPSIYHLIAPFCPSASAPRKQFGSIPRGITIRGIQEEEWGDCLSTINNPHQQHSSIASSQRHFAIGCFSGSIMVYQHLLYNQIGTLDHGEPIRILCFGPNDEVLASAGSRVIRVWNIATKAELWNFDVKSQCMSLAFANQGRQILAAMKDHFLKVWNLANGELVADTNWTEGLEEPMLKLYRRPVTAAFSMDAQLLAVVYKGQDILIWDVEGECLHDIFNRESGAAGLAGRPYGSSGVRCLEFGNGADTDLLAAAYTDGELVLMDVFSGEIMTRGVLAFAHLLARSPDGTKLATADPSGTIQIFQFETLDLLYRIKSVEPGIQGLAFSGYNQHLLDVRGSRGRIWGPAALVGRSAGTFASVSYGPQEIDLKPVEESNRITSVSCDDSGQLFFCGKENGSVYVYDVETGQSISTLFSHAKGVEIIFLFYHAESRTITSVDTSSRVLVHQLYVQSKEISVSPALFDHRAEHAITQAASRPDMDRILICSTESDELWSISQSGSSRIASIQHTQRDSYHWVNHPIRPDQLLLITCKIARIFDWSTLNELTTPEGIKLDLQLSPEMCPRSIVSSFSNSVIAVMYGVVGRPLSNTTMILWKASELKPEASYVEKMSIYSTLGPRVIHLVGQTGHGQSERLVFLQTGNWVSSLSSKGKAVDGSINFHFFLPADWMSTANHFEPIIEVTKLGDIIVVRGDEVAVIRKGLSRVEFQK